VLSLLPVNQQHRNRTSVQVCAQALVQRRTGIVRTKQNILLMYEIYKDIWYSFILQSVLRQFHSLFESGFSTDCELVLPLSIFRSCVSLWSSSSCLRIWYIKSKINLNSYKNSIRFQRNFSNVLMRTVYRLFPYVNLKMSHNVTSDLKSET
jgi:hypothetical protein